MTVQVAGEQLGTGAATSRVLADGAVLLEDLNSEVIARVVPAYGATPDNYVLSVVGGVLVWQEATVTNADTVDGAHASATPTASTIPIANVSGKLPSGWGGSASGLATLDVSSLVVQNPASAQTTPAQTKIPISLNAAAPYLSTGWFSPQTTKGDLVAYSTVPARLAVGTNDYPLIADSTQTLGMKWALLPITGGGTGQATKTAAFDALAPATTKGDIIVFDGSDNVRKAVGTAGYHLIADSTTSDGLAYVDFQDHFLVSPVCAIVNDTATTTETTNTSRFLYMGVAQRPISSFTIRLRIATAAASVTWAEVGIFTGNFPSLGGSASLTRKGYTNIAAIVTSTGLTTTVTITAAVAAGEGIWFAWGCQATTMVAYRGACVDNLSTGGFATYAGQISAMATPSSVSVAGTTIVPVAAKLRAA